MHINPSCSNLNSFISSGVGTQIDATLPASGKCRGSSIALRVNSPIERRESVAPNEVRSIQPKHRLYTSVRQLRRACGPIFSSSALTSSAVGAGPKLRRVGVYSIAVGICAGGVGSIPSFPGPVRSRVGGRCRKGANILVTKIVILHDKMAGTLRRAPLPGKLFGIMVLYRLRTLCSPVCKRCPL